MPRSGLLVACGLLLPLAVSAGPPQLVRDINTQPEAVSSAPAHLSDQGSWLFFTAFNGFAQAPWATDGTAAGTVQLAAIALPAQQTFHKPVVRVGSLTYFFQLDAPWVTDGTPAGTLQLHPNLVGVAPLGSVNGLLVFTGGQSQQAREVWSTNGTVSGTHQLATVDQGRTDKLRAAIVGNRLYFLASGANGIVEPWVSDGTVANARAPCDSAGRRRARPHVERRGRRQLRCCSRPRPAISGASSGVSIRRTTMPWTWSWIRAGRPVRRIAHLDRARRRWRRVRGCD